MAHSSRYVQELSRLMSSIKVFVFGENNSRLENILDRFFSLSAEKKAQTLFIVIATPIVLFILVLVAYFLGMHSLQNNLDVAVKNAAQLKELKAPYLTAQIDFDTLKNNLKTTNQDLNIVFLLQQKASDLGLQATKFPDRVPATDLQKENGINNPLADEFQKMSVDFKLPHVSLKKIIEYVNAVQQMPNHFKVVDLEIQQLFDTKLYFDVSLTVEGLVPLQKKK